MTEPFYDRSTTRKTGPWKFLLVFLVVFFLIAAILFLVDFVPEAPKVSDNGTAVAEAAGTDAPSLMANEHPEVPVRVSIPAVGINTLVSNPVASDVNALDNALLSGAVRYPESGLLGENARMYIFGHQSYLPVVHNQAFKAFNGLQNLKTGDEITVYSSDAAYHYRVSTVTLTTSDAGQIELGEGSRMLTLSTCDSFGTKSDRYVVTANFISEEPLTSSNS